MGSERRLRAGLPGDHQRSEVASLTVLLLLTEKQLEIARLLTNQLVGMNVQSSATNHALAVARRQNIRAAFSGRLFPQDPNEAPASILHDRIRSKRAGSGWPAPGRKRRPKGTVAA